MGRRLSVKDNSVYEFLKEHICFNPNNVNGSISSNRDNISPYHLMRKDLYFKKDPSINVGDAIEFELFDRAQCSNTELVNTYIYDVTEYDDVCVLLKLVQFNVSVVEQKCS